MNLISLIAIYFVVWWLCFFAVLPFGVKSQLETGTVSAGTEKGAPQRPHLLLKIAATSIIAAIVVALLYWLLVGEFIQQYWS